MSVCTAVNCHSKISTYSFYFFTWQITYTLPVRIRLTLCAQPKKKHPGVCMEKLFVHWQQQMQVRVEVQLQVQVHVQYKHNYNYANVHVYKHVHVYVYASYKFTRVCV